MRKNYFGKVLAAIMLLIAGMSLTSCDDVKELFSIDNPDGESTPEAELTVTSNGATFTINTLADVTSFLDQVKAKIDKKAGNLYTIDITANSTLATTSSDNTITLPALTAGYNIKINLKSNLNTAAAPLTIKQAGSANDPLKNNIEVNFLNNDVDLVLNMPGTQVKLNNANSLRMLNGITTVKDGGAIKTYVYGAEKNTDEIFDGVFTIGETVYRGLCSLYKAVTWGDESTGYTHEVMTDNGYPYLFNNLKIVKGAADYSTVNLNNYNYAIEKMTVAEGAVVILSQDPAVKSIEGLGNGAAIKLTNNYCNWWTSSGKKLYEIYNYFSQVNDISNVSITNEPDVATKKALEAADSIISYAYQLPGNLENVTFKYDYIYFKERNSSTGSVKNCIFSKTNLNAFVTIGVPAQSTDIPSYKFSFTDCTFSEGFRFQMNVNNRIYEYDANGNPVYYNTPFYEYYDPTIKDYLYVESIDEVPAGLSYWGPYTWSQQKYTITSFTNYYTTLAIENCKYGNNAFTSETDFIGGMSNYPGVFLRFEIDGTTYKAYYDSDTQKWVLLPV